MVDEKRYLIGHHLSHRALFILEGDVRAADPEAAILAWWRTTGPHREYETMLADTDDWETAEGRLDERGFWCARSVHEIPDDLEAPPPRPRTDEQLAAGDDCLHAHPFVIVESRETAASIWANRILISEDSLDPLVRNAYALSSPQGLGFLHAEKGEIDDETVRDILECNEGPFNRVSMDYVKGRAIKLNVFRDKVRDTLYMEADRERPWYDHSRAAFVDLMRRSLTDADKERNAAVLAGLEAAEGEDR